MKATSKIILTLLAISTISLEVTAQVYDPETGTTHYPNGTIYVGSNPDNPDGEYSSVVGYCVELTRDITCQGHMLFDCNEDPEVCEKLLEEAAESAENGNNGGNSGGGNTEGGESEGAENQRFQFNRKQLGYSSKEWSILMKKMKEKPGMYQYRKGDWIYVKNPAMATKKIIAGLRKK
jgi:hypothetical protein